MKEYGKIWTFSDKKQRERHSYTIILSVNSSNDNNRLPTLVRDQNRIGHSLPYFTHHSPTCFI